MVRTMTKKGTRNSRKWFEDGDTVLAPCRVPGAPERVRAKIDGMSEYRGVLLYNVEVIEPGPACRERYPVDARDLQPVPDGAA